MRTNKVDETLFKEVLFSTTKPANSRDSQWWEKASADIAARFCVPLDEFLKYIRLHQQYPEVLKYVQLGNPEAIVIPPDKFVTNGLREEGTVRDSK